MEFWIASFLFLVFSVSVNCETEYTAAIYEHVPRFSPFETPSRKEALQIIHKNLDIYRDQAARARQKGAQIIVFPEDGLYGFLAGNNRSTVFPFLEDIPEPSKNWNPCVNPDRFNQTEVVQYLSCIARNNSIAVVANMGDVKPCEKSDPNCPADGRYQYNTDVAFDTDGKLIARYHKQHLYYEGGFNTPEKCEEVIFTTSFGVRFGVFTCFDLLFFDPAMELVHDGVRNIVFPTAWMDGLPLLAAVQYQQAFSRQTCTNLLAANLHFPLAKMHGSGIYSCGEAKAYVYDDKSMEGHLLVASLPAMERTNKNHQHQYQSFYVQPEDQKKSFSLSSPYSPQRSYHSSSTFQSMMLDDLYNFKQLEVPSGNITVCSEGLCCKATYNMKNSAGKQIENYAFGVFNGLHNRDNYFLQVCALIKCAGSEQKSCGQPVTKANTVFLSFEIKGNFASNATVFPEVLSSDVELVSSHSINFDGFSLSSKLIDKPLLSAVLFGRVYSKDKNL